MKTKLDDLPNIDSKHIQPINNEKLYASLEKNHKPKILLLYGSLRKVSYSRLLVEECQRILDAFGAQTKIFHADGLPLADDASVGGNESHPKVDELRQLAMWSEGQVWCSPERHGNMTGVMKSQIDWIPLSSGAKRPTQGKTLALLQVNGGSQSFNTVNQMRILGRWMRMVTIPNQSSIPKAFLEFEQNEMGMYRMKPSGFYLRLVDVMEELMKFTLLTSNCSDYLTDRYSERVESSEDLLKRVNVREL